jgi:hypothetical protein
LRTASGVSVTRCFIEAYSTIQFQRSGADIDIRLQQTSSVTSQIRTAIEIFFGSIEEVPTQSIFRRFSAENATKGLWTASMVILSAKLSKR